LSKYSEFRLSRFGWKLDSVDLKGHWGQKIKFESAKKNFSISP
jgi:hypothetical protein